MDDLKVEIVDLLRTHVTCTAKELVEGTSVRSFNYLRHVVRALEREGTIVKTGDVWRLVTPPDDLEIVSLP